MKTTTKHISLLLTILCSAACSGKLINSEKFRNTERRIASARIKTDQSGFLRTGSVTFTTDSAFKAYTVTIFPMDTFTWSLEQGFKGRAFKVEASGVAQQVTKIADSSVADFQHTIQSDYETKVKTVDVISSRAVKKRTLSSLSAIAILAFILIAAGVYWRWFKRN